MQLFYKMLDALHGPSIPEERLGSWLAMILLGAAWAVMVML
jgi:hypothetical protein